MQYTSRNHHGFMDTQKRNKKKSKSQIFRSGIDQWLKKMKKYHFNMVMCVMLCHQQFGKKGHFDESSIVADLLDRVESDTWSTWPKIWVPICWKEKCIARLHVSWVTVISIHFDLWMAYVWQWMHNKSSCSIMAVF